MSGLSLFSGIGGLDLAFEWAGGTVEAMCEIDPYCRKVLQKHWPDIPLFEDVRRLKAEDVGTVDVVYGGFPCQPFSVAGNQKGRDDERYLWPEFSRLVRDLKPRWVVGENVPGILHIAADDVCADLERQGYSVGIFDFEAAAVGAPHRRERFFFVAHARRGMRTGGAISGEVGREHSAGTTYGVERPSEISASILPDNDNIRRNIWGVEEHTIHGGKSTLDDIETSSQTSPNTYSEQCKEQRLKVTAQQKLGGIGRGCGWEPEPGVGRVANGIPHRVDRLRALGNAVVPQQAYPIFRAILEQEGWR